MSLVPGKASLVGTVRTFNSANEARLAGTVVRDLEPSMGSENFLACCRSSPVPKFAPLAPRDRLRVHPSA